MKKKKLLSVLVAVALSCSLFASVPVDSQAAGTTGDSMYRLYNPNSGEHFYTKNSGEKDILASSGWTYEGIAWTAPTSSNTPVYRLYNPNSGEHHYTTGKVEKDYLVSIGWNDEGIGWYSDDNQGVPLYRLYNPNATGQYEAGAHHYTKDVTERNSLVAGGWNDEGIGWYGIDGSGQSTDPEKPSGTLKVDITLMQLDLYSNPVGYAHVSYEKGVSFEGLISDTSVVSVERINETDTGCDLKITGKKEGSSSLILMSSGDFEGPQDHKSITVQVTDSSPITDIISVDKKNVELDLNGNPTDYVLIKSKTGAGMKTAIDDKSIVSTKWGEWDTDNYEVKLYFTGLKVGSTKVTITNNYNDETVVINVTVKDSTVDAFSIETPSLPQEVSCYNYKGYLNIRFNITDIEVKKEYYSYYIYVTGVMTECNTTATNSFDYKIYNENNVVVKTGQFFVKNINKGETFLVYDVFSELPAGKYRLKIDSINT